MAVRWLSATALLLGVCVAAPGQDPITPPPLPVEVPPVLLTVPPAPSALPVPRGPCQTCPTDYHPAHVYLPDRNPDGCGSGGCDGECHPCRHAWVDAAFFVGKAANLSYVNRKQLYGFALDGGYWLTDDRKVGLELGVFSAHGSYREVQSSFLLVDSPITLTTADANARAELYAVDGLRVDGLAGYRYGSLNEKYLLAVGPVVLDRRTENQIHAGQLGVAISSHYGAYFTELTGKVAVGYNEASSALNGAVTNSTGIVSVIPELVARCGYQLGEGLWATAAYRAMYLTNIRRPSQGETDYLLQGLTIGFEKRF